MKTIKSTHVTLIFLLLFLAGQAGAQTPYVKQVITGNSGKFEFAPPFEDFVTLQATNPVTWSTSQAHVINTQSVQDIVTSGNLGFIAAQDSLIRLNLDNMSRGAAVADSGLNKLLVYADKLVVTKQYPVSANFVQVYRLSDLSLVKSIEGIPGDCAGLVSVGDSVYVAVNGGWMGTEGKIAVIETTGWTLARIINLGPDAVGISSIYTHGNKLFTVNKSPYTTPDKGSISVYDIQAGSWANHIMQKNVSWGTGVSDNLLFFGFNYGIASFNMATGMIEDSAVIADPGSVMFRYITSSCLDTLNSRFYVNVGDYISPGYCLVAELNGDSVASFPTGISTDAVAVDYRVAGTGTGDQAGEQGRLSVYPNPTSDVIRVTAAGESIAGVSVFDITGKIVIMRGMTTGSRSVELTVSNLPQGLYHVVITSGSGNRIQGKFLRMP